MATPADQRLLELLEKWLKSLELHIRYSSLDSDSYASIQPWPEHQRPSRWIIDLAVQKTIALRSQVQERIKLGDTKFSDSLELMTFLTNLVGSEHIERFIPFAEPQNERELRPAEPAAPAAPAASAAPTVPAVLAVATVPTVSATPDVAAAQPQNAPDATTGTREMPAFVAARGRALSTDGGAGGQSPSAADATTGTREMPEFVGIKHQAPPPVGTAHVARAERKPASARPLPRAATKHPGKLTVPSKHAAAGKPAAHDNTTAPAPRDAAPRDAVPRDAAPRDASPRDSVPSDAACEQVIADAARLVQWGRKWYELAELIARMAGRPTLPEVRRIIKDNKTAIEKKAGRS